MRNVLLAGIVLMLAATAPALAQPVVGTVTRLSGTARVDGGAGPVGALEPGQQVRESWTVSTGPNSRVLLELADGTTLTLGADTTVTLAHLQVPARGEPTRLTRVLGFIRAHVTPGRGRTRLELETNEVVAAVRGTEWIEHATPDSTEVFVASGRVALRGAGGAVILHPGEGVTFFSTAHSPVTRWAAARIAEFDAATAAP